MPTQINRRRFALCLVTALILVGLLALNQNSIAQDQERTLRAGEKFEVGVGQRQLKTLIGSRSTP